MRLTAGLAPVALAAVACGAYLALGIHPVDLAASDFRAALFDDHGFTLWNGNWYGGHHTLTYSVLAPPLTALLGSVAVAIASTLASAALFAHLARRHFGAGGLLGAAWFGLAAAALVFHGRIAFALGVALGLAAIVALAHRRTGISIVLALLCGLASPVAGLFLAIAGTGAALAGRRGEPFAMAVAANAPVVALPLVFEEEGRQGFAASELLELLAAAAVVAIAARLRGERAILAGSLLYAAAGVLAYAFDSPLGNNVLRLAALAGGPLLACLLLERPLPRAALPMVALVLAAFAFGQWRPAVNDVSKVIDDPAAEPSYYDPLIAFLDRQSGAWRVEVPFTRAHREAAEVARRHPLARGWQRQLDIERNGLFYQGTLTPERYARWLADNGVRFVALPDARLDSSSHAEGRLIERGLPYLRPVWSARHWRVFEVTPRPALAAPPLTVTRLGADGATLEADHPGSAVVKVRWSPHWHVEGGCVERAGDWTRVTARRAGELRMVISFALGDGRRCG